MTKVKVIRLANFSGPLPAYATEGASGMDLRSMDTVTLLPGARLLVSTGLAFEIPRGLEMQIRPRSGMALRQGITVANTPGTVDADYRGEVMVILLNTSNSIHTIQAGDRIAQAVVCPVIQVELEEALVLDPTGRNTGGFGSTGVK